MTLPVGIRRVALAYTGGLDSFIAWRLNHDLFEMVPFHVDLGHPYAAQERFIIKEQDVPVVRLDLPLMEEPEYRGIDSSIIPGRNLTVAVIGAHLAPVVWICAVAGERHPFSNRDKSEEFYYATSGALSYSWQPLRPHTTLMAPYGEMTKAQTVSMALNAGVTEDELRLTRSCYAQRGQCGLCGACFHRWIALSLNGIHEQHEYSPWASPRALDERNEMLRARTRRDFTKYTEARIEETLTALRAKGTRHADR